MPVTAQRACFFLVMLILSSWHLDEGRNDNTMARAASVASLVDRGTLEITAIHEVTGDKALVNGRYYSDKAPLPTFVVLPFHWLGVRLGIVPDGPEGTLGPGLLRLGGFICGSIPFALLITLLWNDLARSTAPRPLPSTLLAALPCFGSFLFVYSGTFYNHLPETLFIFLAARAVVQVRPTHAGVWSGAAFLCGSAMLLLPMVWAAQWLIQGRRNALPGLALGLLPGALFAGLHNMAVTGSPWVFPNAFAVHYQAMHTAYGFGTWQPDAFIHLLFTDHRGLLFYAPFLVCSLWVLPRSMGMKAFLRDPMVLPALLLIAAFLTHATWWGGWTYGPRYLMAAAFLLIAATAQHLPDRPLERIAVPALCLFGLACALAAKSTVWYSLPTEVKHPLLTEIWSRIRVGDLSGWQWPVWLGVPVKLSTVAFVPILAAAMWLVARLDPKRAPQ